MPPLSLMLALGCQPAGDGAVTLWIGGDLHLGDGPTDVLDPLRPLLGDAVGYVDLVGPIADAAPSGEGLRLHHPPAVLPALRASGVRFVGIDNHHQADAGAPLATLRRVGAAGLSPAGIAPLKLDGVEVVVAQFDLAETPPGEIGPWLVKARAQAEHLVVGLHAEGPAAAALAAGVDVALSYGARVVAAHGDHRIGKVERRGDAVVAWGLGDLAWYGEGGGEGPGLVLRVDLPSLAAEIVPVDPGRRGAPATPAKDPGAVLDAVAALGGTPLTRRGDRAAF